MLVHALRGAFTPLGTAAYIAAIALALASPRWREPLMFFAPPGRMSLSTYVGESLLCGFLFLGYGLGHYGQAGPARGALLMAAVYLALALFARWWLANQRSGPLETALRAHVERQT
jgi:uncharacterized protein